MATMIGGVVERRNRIEDNKQLVSELIRKNEFAEPNHGQLTKLFTRLNAINARELTRDMKSYDPAWQDKKVTGRLYGSLTGIPPGSWWGIRMDCSRDRMHDPFSASVQPGPVGAVSVCTSYSKEDVDLGEILTFTGQLVTEEKDDGGKEENLENRSLILNFENGVPLRLIRSYNLLNEYSPKTGYRYDGLYAVVDYWIGIFEESGVRCYKFAFKRLSHQEPPPWKLRDSWDRGAPQTHGKYLSLMEQKSNASNSGGRDNSNEMIISSFSAKSFQSRGRKTNHRKEIRGINAPKVMSLRKREQDTIDGKSGLAEECGKSKGQEAISTMLGYPSRKVASTEQQKNVNVSTIVTRRVSKKLQNNRVDLKQSFECADKPLSNVCPGGEAHHQNEDGEDDCLKSPGSRLQNTNISIRTDLYDSSHNLKHCGKKQGAIAIHAGGVFKPRVLGVPRRELHFAGVDSSPRSSRAITSVKMERMMSLDSSKKPDLGGNNNEKDKPSLISIQSPELIPGMAMNIDSRTASSHSQEHSYASPSAESRLCDDGIEENCRNTVNKGSNESRNSLKLYQKDRWGEKNAQLCERSVLESDLRKNSDNLQPMEYFGGESRPLSESPPFRGFEPASGSGFGGVWAQSSLLPSSLTMENMLDIITVDKTSPIAKMLIGSVIGFPSIDSVRIFQDSRVCGNDREPVSKSCKEAEISNKKIKSQEKIEVESSGQKKWLSSIRTRSYVDLDERVTVRSADQGETSPSSSRESFKFVGKAVSDRNSRKSIESKRFGDKKGENIMEIAYGEEETQLSQELVDSSYNQRRCSTPGDELDSNSNPAKVQHCRSRSLRKTSDATSIYDMKTRRTPNERNRNSPVIKQYSNRKRLRAAEISTQVISRKSISESHEEKEQARKDGDGVSTRVHPGPTCNEPIDEGPESVDTIDCSIENLVESRAAGKSVEIKDAKRTNNFYAESDSEGRTTGNSCLRRPSLIETSKLNNNVCDKLSVNNNTIEKGTLQVSESMKEDKDSAAEVLSDHVSHSKASVSDPVSKNKSSEQIRLVKRSRVRRKHKIEIANLVIDMNMSPRCQISKSERSQRSGNYLRRRGSTTILDQSRKRRNVDPVKHPTSPLKRLKKNVQLRSSSAKVVKGGSKKGLPLEKRSGNRGNSSKNSDAINLGKNNKSVKRMRRTDNKVTKKNLIEPQKTNINSAKKPAEIPKIGRKEDSVAMRMKKTDQEKPIQHSKRDVTARTRSDRALRGVTIGRFGLRRALLPGLETFVRKKKKKRKEMVTETEEGKDSLESPGKQLLSKREFPNNSTLICNYCKLPLNARKPKMVSVMTQCSLISEPLQQQLESVSSIDAAINNESGLHAGNAEYLTANDSGSECICSSDKPAAKVVKNEANNFIETKLESAFDLDTVSRDIEDNESEENSRPVFRRALDRLERREKSEQLFARSDIESADRSKRLTLCGQSDSDSVAKRGFIRYVRSRRKQSAFVPVKPVERNFRIAQLKSIGFKPIKPAIFPPNASEEESECERRRTSDSPRIVYSSGVVKRGVNEEYDKYTSEENNVVQYMDSELCYEDIENEDNLSSSDYYNEEKFGDSDFTQKYEFVKLGSEAEEEDSNDDLEPLEEREEDEEELELELEQDEDDVEEEEAMEEEEEEEEDEEEEEEVVVEVEVEDFKTDDYKTDWEAHLERKSNSCENTEQTVVDSDGDVPWHGWRKIISNEETYFVGW